MILLIVIGIFIVTIGFLNATIPGRGEKTITKREKIGGGVFVIIGLTFIILGAHNMGAHNNKGILLTADRLENDVVYAKAVAVQRGDGIWIAQINDRVYELEEEPLKCFTVEKTDEGISFLPFPPIASAIQTTTPE